MFVVAQIVCLFLVCLLVCLLVAWLFACSLIVVCLIVCLLLDCLFACLFCSITKTPGGVRKTFSVTKVSWYATGGDRVLTSHHNQPLPGLCHAVSIRERLKRLLTRFKVKLVSCDGKLHTPQLPGVQWWYQSLFQMTLSQYRRLLSLDSFLMQLASTILAATGVWKILVESSCYLIIACVCLCLFVFVCVCLCLFVLVCVCLFVFVCS